MIMLISVRILKDKFIGVLKSELNCFFVWRKVIQNPFRAVCAEIFQ